MQTAIEERIEAGEDRTEAAVASPWLVACLSLSTLLPSLNTSIANVGMPVLTQFFGVPFQRVQ